MFRFRIHTKINIKLSKFIKINIFFHTIQTENKSGEDGEEKTDEDKPEEEVKETTEGDEKKEGEEQKEDEKEDKEEKESELNLEEGQTKKSLLDSIKSFKPPKVKTQ